jgi:hypothetical protein
MVLHIDAALEVDCSLFIRQLLFLAGINPMSSVVVLPSPTLTRVQVAEPAESERTEQIRRRESWSWDLRSIIDLPLDAVKQTWLARR